MYVYCIVIRTWYICAFEFREIFNVKKHFALCINGMFGSKINKIYTVMQISKWIHNESCMRSEKMLKCNTTCMIFINQRVAKSVVFSVVLYICMYFPVVYCRTPSTAFRAKSSENLTKIFSFRPIWSEKNRTKHIFYFHPSIFQYNLGNKTKCLFNR
jgi:hypothetical protein